MQIGNKLQSRRLEQSLGKAVEHNLKCQIALTKQEPLEALKEHSQSLKDFIAISNFTEWAVVVLNTMCIDLRLLGEQA